jgi:hypothetical protein
VHTLTRRAHWPERQRAGEAEATTRLIAGEPAGEAEATLMLSALFQTEGCAMVAPGVARGYSLPARADGGVQVAVRR